MELAVNRIYFVSSRISYMAQRISQNVRKDGKCICILYEITVSIMHSVDANTVSVIYQKYVIIILRCFYLLMIVKFTVTLIMSAGWIWLQNAYSCPFWGV